MIPDHNEDMPSHLGIALFAVLLLCAMGLQSAVAARIRIEGGEPNFPFTLSMVAALLSNSTVGACVGFCGGLADAALVGQTVGTFLVSRTIAGWLAGWSTSRLYRGNVFVVIASVWLTSLIAEAIYLLAAPRIGLSHGLKSSLAGTVWNAALAYPLLLLLKRCGWGARL